MLLLALGGFGKPPWAREPYLGFGCGRFFPHKTQQKCQAGRSSSSPSSSFPSRLLGHPPAPQLHSQQEQGHWGVLQRWEGGVRAALMAGSGVGGLPQSRFGRWGSAAVAGEPPHSLPRVPGEGCGEQQTEHRHFASPANAFSQSSHFLPARAHSLVGGANVRASSKATSSGGSGRHRAAQSPGPG